MPVQREYWSSRFAFIMAAVGSAVGLGNFWRFPYTAGENGGGAFLIIYIGCAALIALPILIAEYALGRRGGGSGPTSIIAVARENNKSPLWVVAAWVGGLSGTAILTFYCVISAWIVIYIPQTFSGFFDTMAPEAITAHFGGTISDKGLVALAHGAFVLVNVFVVARGITKGIEAAVQILMPIFFLMLIGMVIYANVIGDFGASAAFLLQPDFSEVNAGTFLSAIGQAFFSIGVGGCLMITYGAYLSRGENIPGSATLVVSVDTLVAIIAGFAIFPLVFAFGLDPAGGPGLFFVTLPIAFSEMPYGALVGGAFFTLALFAAFTSSISLLQIGVAWLSEKKGWSRTTASAALGGLVWIVGVGHIFYPALIDLFDGLTEGVGLPLGGLLIALFAGWAVRRSLLEEIGPQASVTNKLWPIGIAFVAPVSIGVVLVFGFMDHAPAIAASFQALIEQIRGGG
jgi:NSS family neurotransmitter:Na+ symporter